MVRQSSSGRTSLQTRTERYVVTLFPNFWLTDTLQHYLGHSINAPTGRWQKNKDVHWYNREKKDTEAERLEEIRKIKQLEAEALGAVLCVSILTTPAPSDIILEGMSPSPPRPTMFH